METLAEEIAEISQFLQQAETIDYLELVKAFREWVRSQVRLSNK